MNVSHKIFLDGNFPSTLFRVHYTVLKIILLNIAIVYIGLFGQENAAIISISDVSQTTCQVDFKTINNQPTINHQPTMSYLTTMNSATPNLSVNATLNATTDSATSAIIVVSVAGGILGFCTIFICIVGLISIKIIRKKDNLRRGIFTTHSLNFSFNKYVLIM